MAETKYRTGRQVRRKVPRSRPAAGILQILARTVLLLIVSGGFAAAADPPKDGGNAPAAARPADAGPTRLPPPPAPRVEWTPEYVSGRHYVPVKQVAEYYGLNIPTENRKEVIMAREGLRIGLERGERRVKLNEWTFYFSYPPIFLKETLMVPVFDVRNILDPILHPTARRDPAILQTIVIDPAGGGGETGVKSRRIDEKTLTLEVARHLRDFLRQEGFQVVMTREDDRAVSEGMRASLANDAEGEAIFVSLSAGSASPKVHGMECYTYPPAGTPATDEPDSAAGDRRFFAGNINDRESLALATTLQSSTVRAMGAADRGIRRKRSGLLRDVRMPAVLFRMGYLTNAAEAEKLADPDYRVRMAAGMVQGIRRYADYLRRGLEDRTKEDRERPMWFGEISMLRAENPVEHQPERVSVRLPVVAADHATIDRSRVEVQVFAFETVNDAEIDLSVADPPEVNWISVLPDWQAVKTEMLEVSFHRPRLSADEQKVFGRRSFYGYVARLIYDGRVMDEVSSPVNLNRALPHFTPVFPRR